MTAAGRGAWWVTGMCVVAASAAAVRVEPGWAWTPTDAVLWWSDVAAATMIVTAAVSVRRLAVPAVTWCAGTLWLADGLAGLPTTTAAGATLLAASAWLVPGLLVLTLLTATSGRARSAAAVLAVTGSAAGFLVRTVGDSPFLDVDCWRSCRDNPLAWEPAVPAASLLEGLAAGLIAAALLVVARTLGDRVARRAVAAGGAAVVLQLVELAGPGSGPGAGWPVAVHVGAAVFGTLMAVSLLADEVRERRVRRRLARLTVDLAAAPEPGGFPAALRAALGDPGLQVAYWVPDVPGPVDGEGRPAHLPDDASARVTVTTRSGRRLAVLAFSGRADPGSVRRALGPALRLALENDQLRAARLVELHEVDESRRRILERAHEERRRLERNLHDGAQQRVVSLLLLLRMLSSRATEGDAVAVDRAADRTGLLLQELRSIARGIHPAVVADAGLVGALGDLAESSTDVPLTVQVPAVPPLTEVAQSTAYELVATALADARAGGASSVAVRSTVADRRLRMVLEHDAATCPDTDELDGVAVQVEALAGTVEVTGSPRRWNVTMELPCGS